MNTTPDLIAAIAAVAALARSTTFSEEQEDASRRLVLFAQALEEIRDSLVNLTQFAASSSNPSNPSLPPSRIRQKLKGRLDISKDLLAQMGRATGRNGSGDATAQVLPRLNKQIEAVSEIASYLMSMKHDVISGRVKSDYMTLSSSDWSGDPALCVSCSSVALAAKSRRSMGRRTTPSTRQLPLTHLLIRPDCPVCELELRMATDYLRRSGDSRLHGQAMISPATGEQGLGDRPGGYCVGFNIIALELILPSQKKWLNAITTHEVDVPSFLRPVSDVFDSSYFKPLIGNCLNHHAECTPTSGDLSSINFTVIDCSTGDLVRHCTDPYVALSYVWGLPGPNTGQGPGQSFPQTIQDAMTVTLRLGYRYLWVDRYCIDQNDKADVAAQVSRMHIIYGKSVLTIIAACGDGPDYGLPGVGSRPRIPLHRVKTPHMLYEEVVAHPSSPIMESRWATRGWTFQEGLFARRRLVFTDYEAYLQCCMQGTWESSEVECDHDENWPLPLRSLNPLEAVFLLREYSTRSLTKDTDILAASAAMLVEYETNGSGFRHCWGLPILPHIPTERSSPHQRYSYNVDFSRDNWTPARALFFSLGWFIPLERYDATPLLRRRDSGSFPSWSWCGWKGPIGRFPWQIESGRSDKSTFDESNVAMSEMSFSLEVADGALVDWETYSQLDHFTRQESLSRFIHITARTTDVCLKVEDEKAYFSPIDQGSTHTAEWTEFQCNIELTTLPSRGLLIHLVPAMFQYNKVSSGGHPILLVLGEVGGFMERLGVSYKNPVPGYADVWAQSEMRTTRMG